MVDRTGERELLDAEQVAAMLVMTSDWVYELSPKGRIPTDGPSWEAVGIRHATIASRTPLNAKPSTRAPAELAITGYGATSTIHSCETRETRSQPTPCPSASPKWS